MSLYEDTLLVYNYFYIHIINDNTQSFIYIMASRGAYSHTLYTSWPPREHTPILYIHHGPPGENTPIFGHDREVPR